MYHIFRSAHDKSDPGSGIPSYEKPQPPKQQQQPVISNPVDADILTQMLLRVKIDKLHSFSEQLLSRANSNRPNW